MADTIKKLKIQGEEVRVKQAETYYVENKNPINISDTFNNLTTRVGTAENSITSLQSGKLDKVTGSTTKDQIYIKKTDGTQGMMDVPEAAVVDTEMKDDSTNAVQNKVIKKYVDVKQNKVIAGTSGNLMAFSGTEGTINAITPSTSISISSTDSEIPTAKAVHDLRGAAKGVASLDDNKKILAAELPDYILGQLMYGGNISAHTTGQATADITLNLKNKLGESVNEIYLINNATDDKTNHKYGYKTLQGVYFICKVPFVVEVSGATVHFAVGDWLIGAGTYWDKIDNTDAVTSVNGKIGAVVLKGSDIEVSDTNTDKIDVALDKKLSIKTAESSDNKTYIYGYDKDGQKDIDLSTKQDVLTSGQQAAVDSGIESGKVAKYDGYETTIASKSTVSVSDTGTATDVVSYITVDGTSKKLPGEVYATETSKANKKFMRIVSYDASGKPTTEIIEYSFE